MKKFNLKGASADSLLLTAVKLVTMLTGILQTKILSVGLSLGDNGTYSQTIIVISIASSILLLGLGDGINYYYNSSEWGDKENRDKWINTIFAIETVAGVFLAACILLFRQSLGLYFSNEQLSGLISIVALKPVIDNLLALFQILFVSCGKAKIIAVRNLLISLLKLAITAVAVFFFDSLTMILIAVVCVDTLQLVFFAYLFGKNTGFPVNPFKGSAAAIKPILSYCLPMGIYALTHTLTREADRLVIGFFSSPEEMAIYTNCSKMLPFDIISVSFATVLIPYIMKFVSSKQYTNVQGLLRNYIKIGYYSSWVFGAGIMMCARQAIIFFYSEEYVVGLPIFLVYVVDSMIKFASMHLVITANGDSKYLMKLSVLSLIGNIILNVALYIAIGDVGPALATMIVTILYTLLVLKKSMNIVSARIRDIFDLKDMLTFVCGVAALAIIFGGLNHWMISQGINQILAMLLSLGTFGIVNLVIWRKRITHALAKINEFKL